MTVALEREAIAAPSHREPELSERERQVIVEYVTGDDGIAGNITRSYQRVYPNANENTASVAGSKLLALPRAERFLAELHEEATRLASQRLVPWIDLLPLAQATIVAHARGQMKSRLAYEASVYLVNRVLGTPVASHDVHVRDDARIIRAVTAFAQRMSEHPAPAPAER